MELNCEDSVRMARIGFAALMEDSFQLLGVLIKYVNLLVFASSCKVLVILLDIKSIELVLSLDALEAFAIARVPILNVAFGIGGNYADGRFAWLLVLFPSDASKGRSFRCFALSLHSRRDLSSEGV